MNLKFWKRETRQAQPANFTDARVEILQILAQGEDAINARTGVVEFCASLWERAFLSADTDPIVPASTLGWIGRRLITAGEAVMELRIVKGDLRFLPASTYDVRGSAARWRYSLTVAGPTTTATRKLSADQVIHVRYGVGLDNWRGDGGLQGATTTVAGADALEQRLKEEVSGKVGHVVPVPQPDSGLQSDLQALGGKTVLVPSTVGGWDQQGAGGGQSVRSDWTPKRIGANPPATLVQLRGDFAQSILAAAGIPPILAMGGDSTGMREAWRLFLHSTIAPVARLVEEELTVKLERDIVLNFDRLMASDIQGRARSFQSMVGGGMAVEKAAMLAGLMEAE